MALPEWQYSCLGVFALPAGAYIIGLEFFDEPSSDELRHLLSFFGWKRASDEDLSDLAELRHRAPRSLASVDWLPKPWLWTHSARPGVEHLVWAGKPTVAWYRHPPRAITCGGDAAAQAHYRAQFHRAMDLVDEGYAELARRWQERHRAT